MASQTTATSSPNSWGSAYPTVSGTLTVVAPALDHGHPAPGEPVGDRDLLRAGERDPRSLLAVAERGVEEPDDVLRHRAHRPRDEATASSSEAPCRPPRSTAPARPREGPRT